MINDGKMARRRFSIRKTLSVSTVVAVALCLFVGIAEPNATSLAQSPTGEATAAATSQKTAQIVDAANAFLAKLNDDQKATVLFDFSDTTQKKNWSNFPTGLFNRAGLAYGLMTDDQRASIMALLKTVLSDQGYQKVMNIMTADEITNETGTGAGGPDAQFGYSQYYVSILGTPSVTDPWMLQWGGHHLALNVTFVGNQTVMTPSHTGCQPCVYTLNNQTVQVLGSEYSKALALVNALDTTQKSKAVLNYSVTDLVDGPGEEDRVLTPEGLPASEMTADQQAMLLDVISQWVGITNDDASATRMAEIKAKLADTYFAWSGSTDQSSTSYFRVTGPTLLIEFAPQGNGGGGNGGPGNGGTPGGPGPDGTRPAGGFGGNAPTTQQATAASTAASTLKVDLGTFSIVEQTGTLFHVHTIYRDPTNAYGAALLGQ